MNTVEATQKSVKEASGEVASARKAVAEASGADKAAAQEILKAKKAALNKAWGRRAFWWSTGIISAAGIATLLVGILGALKRVRTCTTMKTRTNGVLKTITVCPNPVRFEQSVGQFALTWAGPVTAAVLILVACISVGQDKGGLVAFAVGKDNRLSTSKLQVVLWTIAIVFAFFFFLFQILKGASGAAFNSLDPAYLLLLGGPFAAAVLAKAATTSKTNEGTVQQVPADSPKASTSSRIIPETRRLPTRSSCCSTWWP